MEHICFAIRFITFYYLCPFQIIPTMTKISLFFTIFLSSFWLFSQSISDTIHVTHYNINLSITNLPQHQIQGYTTLSVLPKINGITFINLHLQGLSVDSVHVNTISVPFNYQSPFLQIPTSPLNIVDTQYVSVYYKGNPIADPYWGGFFFSGSYAYNMGVGMQSIPPSFGRCWFPCIDDFNDKATYQFHIETDSNKMAVCGGLLTDSLTLPSGNKRWTWTLTDPIPTYLASVAVGPYSKYSDTILVQNGIVPIEIYASAAQLPQLPASFINLKKVILGFEQKFGAYRWQRVGYVLVPFNAGAMEHATNIAYPSSAVNGTLANQSLWIHELSHSWFGNLLTCSEATTMWINEGFARYAEIIADEILDTTGTTALNTFRSLHRSVLKNAHIDDDGYFALDQVPANATYGTTTYDKGGIVVHSLRGYLGDSLFFSGLKTLFDQNEFGSLNSVELFQKLSEITNVDLTHFYEGWVHQPGFLHFSIDSIIPMNQQDGYILSMKQKLFHALYLADNNKVDVAFYSNTGDYHFIPQVQFSGESDYVQVSLPFHPDFWILDPNEKLADAIIDYTVSVPDVGLVSCNDAYFKVKSVVASDTSLIRVEYNLATPDPLRSPNPNVFRISNHHYWKVEFLENHITSGELQFRYASNGASSPDADLMNGFTKDDLILLYRRNATQDWQIIPSSVTGNPYLGTLTVNQMLAGEYLLAVGNDQVGMHQNEQEIPFEIFPNPATNILFYTIPKPINTNVNIEFYDPNGKLLSQTPIHSNVGQMDISTLNIGIFFVVWTQNGQKMGSKKITKLN